MHFYKDQNMSFFLTTKSNFLAQSVKKGQSKTKKEKSE